MLGRWVSVVRDLLEGSFVVISGVISPRIRL